MDKEEIKKITLKTKLNSENGLSIQFVYNETTRFETVFSSPHIDINKLKINLDERKFELTSLNESKLSIETFGGIKIEAEAVFSVEKLMQKLESIEKKIVPYGGIKIEEEALFSVEKLMQKLESIEKKIVPYGGMKIEAEALLSVEKVMQKLESIEKKIVPQITESRGWVKAGTLKDIDSILNKYPIYDYAYGMMYNHYTIEEIMITKWNVGMRVSFRNFYPHNDDALGFHAGNAIFTRDTRDKESKGIFYHRYVDRDYKVCCGGNGECDSLHVYVKHF